MCRDLGAHDPRPGRVGGLVQGLLDDRGALDRRAMRERAFTDATARSRLEALVHPAIRARLLAKMAAFDSAITGYLVIVGFLTRHLAVSGLVIAGLFASLYYLFTLVPTSFIPDEDKGFFMIDVQLQEAASLNRTAQVVREINDTLMADDAIEYVLAVNGYSLLNIY